MATPGSEDHSSSRQSALNSEDDLYGDGRSRKRSRRLTVANNDNIVWDLNDDGRPKTRRVNPQRLAVRLGPELVAEMEAYIVPGAKMPPFSVRKDLQERYSVDRRHIYDYFHSRGLRVAKEDRHTNLIRGRAMKAQAMAQQAQAQSPTTKPGVKEEVFTGRPTPSKLPQYESGPTLTGRSIKRLTKTLEKKSNVMRRSTPKSVRKTSSFDGLDGSLGTLSESSSKTTSYGQDDDWDAASPQFTLPCDSSDESVERSTTSDFLPSPVDFLAGFFETPNLPVEMEGVTNGEDFASFIPVDQERLLTQGERNELYDLISGSMAWSSVADRSSRVFMSSDNSSFLDTRLPMYDDANTGRLVGKACVNSLGGTYSDCQDLKPWLSDDLLQQSIVDMHRFASLPDGFEASGLHDLSSSTIDNGGSAEYYQATIQNRLPTLRASP